MTRRFGGVVHHVRAWLGLFVLVLALLPQGASASYDGRVSGTGRDGVWLKEEPALDAPRIKALPEGAPITLLDGEWYAGDGRYWAWVEADGDTGFMVIEYLLVGAGPDPTYTTPPPAPRSSGFAPGTWAQVAGTYPVEGLRLRAAPAPWEEWLAILPEGSTLEIVEGPVAGGNGNPWYGVVAGGLWDWVDGTYLVLADTPALSDTLGGSDWAQVTGTYPAEGLRVRSAPAPWEARLSVVPEGAKLRILDGPVQGGDGDPWFYITADGVTGWVNGLYLVPAGPPSGDWRPRSGSAGGNALVQLALAEVGKPYAWGGTGPDAFDCSGLVLYVAEALGIDIPRVAADQAFAGVHVDYDQLAPGDLVFYANTYEPGITHVGIYIGNNRWVTAQDEYSGVLILSLDVPYWKTRYAGARRIT